MTLYAVLTAANRLFTPFLRRGSYYLGIGKESRMRIAKKFAAVLRRLWAPGLVFLIVVASGYYTRAVDLPPEVQDALYVHRPQSSQP
jgi:hypothetical protein